MPQISRNQYLTEEQITGLCRRIKEYRKRYGLKQHALAKLIGTSQSHLAGIETGRCPNISVGLAYRIAKTLDVSLECLIDGEDKAGTHVLDYQEVMLLKKFGMLDENARSIVFDMVLGISKCHNREYTEGMH